MKVKDPVCGMTVEEKDSKATCTYDGKTYHFCSDTCKKKFEKDPTVCAGEKTSSKGFCCCGSKPGLHKH